MVHLHVFDTSGFLFDLPLSSDQFQAFARSPAVEDAMAMDTENMAATGGDFPESVNAGYLSPNAFAFLGVPPLLGRVFTPDDARNPAEPEHVVVLSYPYRQSHYGGQTNIVGRMLSLDHQGYEIVGVMPRRFAWWDGDVYVPLKQSTDPDRLATVFARLRPGVSDRRAEEILGPLIDTMAKDRPGHFPRQFQIRLLHMTDIAAGQLSGAIGAVSVAAGLLLLVGCANVSILLLARGTSKTQELAVRVALGASRGRLMRQLLTESMLISLGGAAAGVLLASPVVDSIPRLLPAGTFPAESVIHVSAPVLLVCAGIAILTGGLFGLWPAVQCSHPELQTIMRAGSRKLTGHPATSRGHNVLIHGPGRTHARSARGSRRLWPRLHSAPPYNAQLRSAQRYVHPSGLAGRDVSRMASARRVLRPDSRDGRGQSRRRFRRRFAQRSATCSSLPQQRGRDCGAAG